MSFFRLSGSSSDALSAYCGHHPHIVHEQRTFRSFPACVFSAKTPVFLQKTNLCLTFLFQRVYNIRNFNEVNKSGEAFDETGCKASTERKIFIMNRVYNFSAGPSMLPESVLKRAAAEMLDYEGSGQSVMEMSHRSKVYDAIIKGAESLLREVMQIPDNYKVLFLQGGASSQFAMVPLNLMTKNHKADYVLSGQFSTKDYKEAARFGDCKVVASSKEDTFSHIPALDKNEFRPDADYFHICMNNTIYGTAYHELPQTGDVPLVADISSYILSQPIDVTKFGVLYAGAQKNMAPAGVTIVIIRDDLIGNAMDITPTMFNYKTHADNGSMFNTPPCYTIYIAKLVLEWVKNEIGGLEAMKERNEKKAKLLYDFLDNSKLFKGTVVPEDRSLMNVPFVTGNADLDAQFVKEASARGFENIKGHRSVGGMRASIYNAMPYEGVDALVKFMAEFEKANG